MLLIYWEVGKALLERGSPYPLYRRWIETYGGEEFAEVVHAVLSLTDRLGPELSSAERRRAARHFATTARYGWMFWDMGHRREGWPVRGDRSGSGLQQAPDHFPFPRLRQRADSARRHRLR